MSSCGNHSRMPRLFLRGQRRSSSEEAKVGLAALTLQFLTPSGKQTTPPTDLDRIYAAWIGSVSAVPAETASTGFRIVRKNRAGSPCRIWT